MLILRITAVREFLTVPSSLWQSCRKQSPAWASPGWPTVGMPPDCQAVNEGRATSYYTASGISSKEKRALDAVYPSHWASLGAQTVKNPPAMQETWVRSLGWEDPLEEGVATHPSILSWRIPRTEGPGGLQSVGWQRVGHDLVTKHSPASIPLG